MMIALFFLLISSNLYSMEFVSLLHNSESTVNEICDVELNDFAQIKRNNMFEKLFLVHHIPELLEAKNAQQCIKQLTLQLSGYELRPDKKKDLFEQERRLYQRKIIALQKQIRESIQKKYQYPDEIRFDINGCLDTAYGAAAGGCCGASTGVMGMCVYGEIEAYRWCCCNIAPNKVIWDVFAYGCPVLAAVGCLLGSLCVVCGLHKRIRCDS